MLLNNTIIAIAAVSIIVVAGAATAFVVTNNNDEKTSVYTPDCYLVVYGNANSDNYLDSNDIDYINKIINGNITWNKIANPFADANRDGSVDYRDAELVQKFINNESATMYYNDYYGKVSSV